MGYWISEDDEDTFESKEEMVRYVIENEHFDDYYFYEWLNENYNASDILQNNMEEYEYIDEYNDYRVEYEAPDAEEGETYEYDGFTFDWVEEEEEEEEEEE